jgi:hypothetical protein
MDEGVWVAPDTAKLFADYVLEFCMHMDLAQRTEPTAPATNLTDFSIHAMSEQLITIFAHLDAFLNATVQMILTRCPAARKPVTGRQRTLSEEEQIEREVLHFGKQDLPDRVKELRERFNVDFEKGVDADLLRQAQPLRPYRRHREQMVPQEVGLPGSQARRAGAS